MNDLEFCEYKITERMKVSSRGARTVKSEHSQRSKLKSKATLVACAESRRRWPGWSFGFIHSLAEYRRCKYHFREERTSNSSKSKNPKAVLLIHLRNLSILEQTTWVISPRTLRLSSLLGPGEWNVQYECNARNHTFRQR